MKALDLNAAVLCLAVTFGVSCSSSRTSLSQYLDGCQDKQGFLLREGLQWSEGQPVTLGPVIFRPPPGSYVRVERDCASIVQGVYCDSGDWGINPGNYIRLKLYPHPPPVDLYADVPEEVAYVLQRKASPFAKVDHEFSIYDIHWKAQVELWGTVIPSIRTAYLTTTIGSQTLAVTFVTENGSAANPSAFESVLRSIIVPGDR